LATTGKRTAAKDLITHVPVVTVAAG